MTARLLSPDGRLELEPLDHDRLVRLVAGDLTALAPWVAAPGWPHDDTVDALGAAAHGWAPTGDPPFLVVERRTRSVVGEAGTKGPLDSDGALEIGYGLARSARGRGLGHQLVRTLAGWAAARPGCRAVRAEVLADNLPSRRALEGAGFAVERVEGGYVWYALAGRAQ